jgi:hypothetical protein
MVPYGKLADPAKSVDTEFHSAIGFGFHDHILFSKLIIFD